MPRRKACQWRRNNRRCRLGSSSATCLSYRGNMTVSASGEEAVHGMLLTCIARTSLSESICASWRPQSLSWRTVRDTSGQDGLHRRPRGVCRHGRRRELQQPKMSAAQLTCSVEGVHTSSQHQRARSRHERVHGQVSCQLQSIQSITRELPPYDSLDVHVSQEHHEVALGPPLAGMCSTGPLRGALTAPHPGVGVGAVQAASKTQFHSVILGYDTVISSMTQTSSRYSLL